MTTRRRWAGWVLLDRDTKAPRAWQGGAVELHATKREAEACRRGALEMAETDAAPAYLVLVRRARWAV